MLRAASATRTSPMSMVPASLPVLKPKAVPLLRWRTLFNQGEWNPVFVKEMRQAVRGQWVLTMFVVLLTVMFGVSAGLLLNTTSAQPYLGRDLFMTLLGTLTVLTGVCVPAWSTGRMLQERGSPEDVDLLYYTPMSAEEIIQGKFLSNVTLTVVFFSAGAPFLAITPLLRGVDVPTVIMITGLGILTVVFVSQATLVVASLPAHRVWKMAVGVMVALAASPCLIIWVAVCVSYVFSERGVGLPLPLFFAVALVFGFLAINILIVMAASYIAPRNGIFFRRGPLAERKPARSPSLPPPLP